jgi:hypothetical protein
MTINDNGGENGSGFSTQQPEAKRAKEEEGGGSSTLQRLASALGHGGSVLASAPHRNSRASTGTITDFLESEDPMNWTAASATTQEAAFVNDSGRRGEDKALAADYLQRRLAEGQDAPAWLSAVAEDGPAVSRWWR